MLVLKLNDIRFQSAQLKHVIAVK